MDKLNIRQVTIEDTKDILKIYEPYILNTPITFEYDLPSIKEFEERIRKITSKYPYLVCEENNKIIGYAYASEYKGRKAYDYTVELSIYIKEGYNKKGIGKKFIHGINRNTKKTKL